MNSDLQLLQPYPFEKLRALLAGAVGNPDLSPLSLTIGEPTHEAPGFVLDTLAREMGQYSVYPTTAGVPALLQAIVDWLNRRIAVPAVWLGAARHVLAVTVTRAALFSLTQALVQRGPDVRVLSPSPFYQFDEGAALLAGAQPQYLACTEENGFIPDFA